MNQVLQTVVQSASLKKKKRPLRHLYETFKWILRPEIIYSCISKIRKALLESESSSCG
jgi:hypothetical protein